MGFIKDLFKQKKQVQTSLDSQVIEQAKQPKAECPYCQKPLEQMPTRNKKCPHCGQQIYVKRSPSEVNKRLATEREAKEIENQWEERNFIKYELPKLDISEKQFNAEEKLLSKKFGKDASQRDVIWSLLNKRISQVKDYEQLRILYYEMALFVHEEARDPFKLLKQAAKMELLDFQKDGIKEVEIFTSGNGCDACNKLHSKVFTIEQALREMPIPNKECLFHLPNNKFPFCRCSYNAILPKTDEDLDDFFDKAWEGK